MTDTFSTDDRRSAFNGAIAVLRPKSVEGFTMSIQTNFVVLLLVTCIVFPASLQAQQTVKFTEYGFEDHPIDINTIELANGDTLTTGRFYHYIVPSTEGWLTAAQYCVSTRVSRNGQLLLGSGSCVRTDTDGDYYGVLWTTDGWKTLPGTGKYENLQCEGNTTLTDQFSGVSGRFINQSEMTCAER